MNSIKKNAKAEAQYANASAALSAHKVQKIICYTLREKSKLFVRNNFYKSLLKKHYNETTAYNINLFLYSFTICNSPKYTGNHKVAAVFPIVWYKDEEGKNAVYDNGLGMLYGLLAFVNNKFPFKEDLGGVIYKTYFKDMFKEIRTKFLGITVIEVYTDYTKAEMDNHYKGMMEELEKNDLLWDF